MWEPEDWDWDSPICHSKWSLSACVDPPSLLWRTCTATERGKKRWDAVDGWMDGWRPHMDTRHSPYKGMAVCCDSRGLTHEQTSPQHHAKSTDTHTDNTLHVSLLDLLRGTHTCQNTMWTAQTERWWEQTLHHHTHFTHYTSNFFLSLHFNFIYPRTPFPSFLFLSPFHVSASSLSDT